MYDCWQTTGIKDHVRTQAICVAMSKCHTILFRVILCMGTSTKVTGMPLHYLTVNNIPPTALMIMFERELYPVREDAGSLSYRLIASSTAAFDYQVVVTVEDGSATCEHMHDVCM